MKFVAVESRDFDEGYIHAPRDFCEFSPACISVDNWIFQCPGGHEGTIQSTMKKIKIVADAYDAFCRVAKNEKYELRHLPWVCLNYRWDVDDTFLTCVIFKCENNGNTYIIKPDGDVSLNMLGI